MQSQLLIKVFIGIPLTSELRMHLKNSKEWNQTLIKPIKERDLVETHFEAKDYLGYFLEDELVVWEKVKQLEEGIIKTIHCYCPMLKLDKLHCSIFPQIFLP